MNGQKYKFEPIALLNKILDEIASIGPKGQELIDSMVWDKKQNEITGTPNQKRENYKIKIRAAKGQITLKVLNRMSSTDILYCITSKKIEFEVLGKIKHLTTRVIQESI